MTTGMSGRLGARIKAAPTPSLARMGRPRRTQRAWDNDLNEKYKFAIRRGC
jgi:hypothetical protein